MDFDFNLILVPVTILLFIVWLLDKVKFKQRKTKGKGNENLLISWAYDFWPVLAVVLVLRSFLFEPFNIPSDSMVPTLETGDFILVNKFDYGVRLPIINKKIIDVNEPKRGEVIVFRYPANPKISYIKRVVGLPGDHIESRAGNLFINGQKVLTASTQINRVKDAEFAGKIKINYLLETLGEHQHLVRHLEGVDPVIGTYNEAMMMQDESKIPFVAKENTTFVNSKGQDWEVTVPKGQYFAMGDNREQSSDSRIWGFVPEENLAGRAFFVWMHKEPGLHLPSFSRNGKIN